MIAPIPGFGLGAKEPNPSLISTLKTIGVYAGNLTVFANEAHFASAAPGLPAPRGGTPKYWCNPNLNRAPYYIFLKRGPQGGYVWRKMTRDATQNALHLAMFSHSALSFYDARPGFMVPDLELRPMSAAESGRLSFETMSFDDPVDTPIAEVWGFTQNGNVITSMQHSFPGEYVLFGENNQPYLGSLTSDLYAKFPYGYGLGGGSTTVTIQPPVPFASADVIAAMRALTYNTPGARQQVHDVLTGPVAGTDAQLAKILEVVK